MAKNTDICTCEIAFSGHCPACREDIKEQKTMKKSTEKATIVKSANYVAEVIDAIWNMEVGANNKTRVVYEHRNGYDVTISASSHTPDFIYVFVPASHPCAKQTVKAITENYKVADKYTDASGNGILKHTLKIKTA